jgi:hypothetical protein
MSEELTERVAQSSLQFKEDEIDIAKYLCNQFETVEFLENFRKGTARNKIFENCAILKNNND